MDPPRRRRPPTRLPAEDHHGRLYTAGSTPGPYRVIATQKGGTKSDTSQVTVVLPAPTATFRAEPSGHVACRPDPGSTRRPWNGVTGKVIRTRSPSTPPEAPSRQRCVHGGSVLGTFLVAAACSCSVRIPPRWWWAFVHGVAPHAHPAGAESILPVAGAGRHQQFSVSALWSDGSTRCPPYLVGDRGP